MRGSALFICLMLYALLCMTSGCEFIKDPYQARRNDFFSKIEDYIGQYEFAQSTKNSDNISMLEDTISKFSRENQDILFAALNKFENEYEQALAAFALGFINDIRVYKGIVPLLRQGTLKVKYNALGSVGTLAKNGVITLPDVDVKLMVELLSSPDQEIVTAVLYALQNLVETTDDSPEIIQRCRKLLFHKHPRVRNEAVILVGRARDVDSYGDLMKLKFDTQPVIRKNVAVAISRMKLNDAVPDLIEFLRDPDGSVVKAAHLGLIKVTGKDYGSSYQVWKERYKEWQEELLRYYTCPIHSDIRETASGRCKICKRQLIVKEMVYQCVEHKSYQRGSPGSCEKCNRVMVLREKAVEPESIYYCQQHRDVIKFEFGRCPICDQPLREKGAKLDKKDE